MKTFTIDEQAHKGIQVDLQPGQPTTLCGLPCNWVVPVKEPCSALLHWVDVWRNGEAAYKVVKEVKASDNRALVLIKSSNVLDFASNVTIEEWDDKKCRVVRSLQGFPSLGIDYLHERHEEDGSIKWLLTMHPGASFRILRRGETANYIVEMTVSWNGRWNPIALQGPQLSTMNFWGMKVNQRIVPAHYHKTTPTYLRAEVEEAAA